MAGTEPAEAYSSVGGLSRARAAAPTRSLCAARLGADARQVRRASCRGCESAAPSPGVTTQTRGDDGAPRWCPAGASRCGRVRTRLVVAFAKALQMDDFWSSRFEQICPRGPQVGRAHGAGPNVGVCRHFAPGAPRAGDCKDAFRKSPANGRLPKSGALAPKGEGAQPKRPGAAPKGEG